MMHIWRNDVRQSRLKTCLQPDMKLLREVTAQDVFRAAVVPDLGLSGYPALPFEGHDLQWQIRAQAQQPTWGDMVACQ